MGQALGLDACTGRSNDDGDETDFDDFFDCEEEVSLDAEALLPAFGKELQQRVSILEAELASSNRRADAAAKRVAEVRSCALPLSESP